MNGQSQALLAKTRRLLTGKTTQFRSLTKIKQLHAHTITSGLLCSPQSTRFHARIAGYYANWGHVPYAGKLFVELPHRSTALCNYMIKMYTKDGLFPEVLKVFVEMFLSGHCCPDNYTYSSVIKACSELSLLKAGEVVHGKTLVSKFGADTYVQNPLLAMYMNCGEMNLARRVFDAMRERNVISWNTMISGYAKNGFPQEALMVFNWMQDCGFEIDAATAVSTLPVCGILRELTVGRRVHELVEEKCLIGKTAVSNALVDMYAKCGSLDEARMVFDEMVGRDVVSWTSMINGYVLNGAACSALTLFRMMHTEGVRPNSVTVALVLLACASLNRLKDGRCLHGWVIKGKLDTDVGVETSLIDLYAKCDRLHLSFAVFMKTSRKRTVPWNALLSGCIHNGKATEAIGLFKQMLTEGVELNGATFNSLLPAYAILADLQPATNVHCYLLKSGFLSRIEVATCMIDIYSKCGSLELAHGIFDDIPADIKDIYVWSVIIASYGMHGHGDIAVSLFRPMIQSGVKPNRVTFTSVLHACSHRGLVDEGLHLFEFMMKSHQNSISDDHYTCIVDLLGRAGRLREAYDLISKMPVTPSYAVWGALLGASVTHGNVEVGEVAAQWLFKLEPANTGNYVLLAKLYAAVERWEDAENVRHMMNDIGLRKAPGHSLIDVRNS